MNFDINNNEKVKKIAVISSIVLLIIGLVLGIRLIRERADIRNRAAGPPACTLESRCSVDPLYQGPNLIIKVFEGTTPAPIITGIVPTVFFVEFPADNAFNPYRCEVVLESDPGNPACKEETSADAPICLAPSPTPTETPTPTEAPTGTLTPTPTPINQSASICQDCSNLSFNFDYNQPGDVNDQNHLYIGRVKITQNACSRVLTCEDVESMYIVASTGSSCANIVGTPTPAWAPFVDSTRGELEKCDALPNPTLTPPITPPGAEFRLHQAQGADCRCYQARVDFKDTLTPPILESGTICPSQLQICCPAPAQCQPQIIEGCAGDPQGGPPAGSTNSCYFDLTGPNQGCPNINVESQFQTHVGTDFTAAGSINFDDDFRNVDSNGNQRVQNVPIDVGSPKFTYADGGVYDVVLDCKQPDQNVNNPPIIAATCKKRFYVTCNAGCPVINYVGGPTGGPTGAPICQ